jgi:hypothetical protein
LRAALQRDLKITSAATNKAAEHQRGSQGEFQLTLGLTPVETMKRSPSLVLREQFLFLVNRNSDAGRPSDRSR